MKKLRRCTQTVALAALTAGAFLTSCNEYDLDERTPEGWGSSIYGWLADQGNYTNTVRMIDESILSCLYGWWPWWLLPWRCLSAGMICSG